MKTVLEYKLTFSRSSTGKTPGWDGIIEGTEYHNWLTFYVEVDRDSKLDRDFERWIDTELEGWLQERREDGNNLIDWDCMPVNE